MRDQTAMCPKHGISHGVCVDPIKTETAPEREAFAIWVEGRIQDLRRIYFDAASDPKRAGLRAQEIRDELAAKGVVLDEKSQGTRWHRKLGPRVEDAEFMGSTTGSCTFCGETGITFPHTCPSTEPQVGDEKSCPDCGKTWYFGERHICTLSPPNRFDPYEALDTILDALRDLSLAPRHSVNNRISRKVYALRAYITGREHG